MRYQERRRLGDERASLPTPPYFEGGLAEEDSHDVDFRSTTSQDYTSSTGASGYSSVSRDSASRYTDRTDLTASNYTYNADSHGPLACSKATAFFLSTFAVAKLCEKVPFGKDPMSLLSHVGYPHNMTGRGLEIIAQHQETSPFPTSPLIFVDEKSYREEAQATYVSHVMGHHLRMRGHLHRAGQWTKPEYALPGLLDRVKANFATDKIQEQIDKHGPEGRHIFVTERKFRSVWDKTLEPFRTLAQESLRLNRQFHQPSHDLIEQDRAMLERIQNQKAAERLFRYLSEALEIDEGSALFVGKGKRPVRDLIPMRGGHNASQSGSHVSEQTASEDASVVTGDTPSEVSSAQGGTSVGTPSVTSTEAASRAPDRRASSTSSAGSAGSLDTVTGVASGYARGDRGARGGRGADAARGTASSGRGGRGSNGRGTSGSGGSGDSRGSKGSRGGRGGRGSRSGH